MTSNRSRWLIALSLTVLVGAVSLYAFSPGLGAEESPSGEDTGDAANDGEPDAVPVPDGIAVVYRGVLQNEAGQPVSGVFPLTFRLYRGAMSAQPLWSEDHFISVVDGRYQVTLGESSPLREHLLSGERWIGIELDGQDEILRDQIIVESPGGSDVAEPDSRQRLSHADVADRAAEAERARIAENAEALDGMTAEEIEDMANLAMQRLGEHIADPDAHAATSGPTIGSPARTADDEAGGTGGTSYEINCPDGHVATGIKGGAGRLVDSITLICSPLE